MSRADERNQSRTGRRILALLLCFLCLTGLMPPALAEELVAQTVRVAVIGSPNFLERKADGTVYGMAAEYLSEIAKYTGWHYTYVDMPLHEALEALQTGQIDLVPGLEYSEERAALFDLSSRSIGPTTTILCVSASDMRYHFGDFVHFDGMRVGTLRGASFGQQLTERLDQEQVTATLTEYDDDAALQAALAAGEVDAVLFSNLDRTAEDKIIASFCPSYMRFGLNPAKPFLREGVDAAMEQILSGDAYYGSKLYQRYYSAIPQSISFTPTEQAYIDSHGPVTIALSTGIYPIEYYDAEAGDFAGFTVDYLALLSDYTGLTFTFVPRTDAAAMKAQAEAGSLDMIGTIVSGSVTAALGVTGTDAPYSNTLSIIEQVGSGSDPQTDAVGVLAGYPYFKRAAADLGFTDIREYTKAEDAVEDVNCGRIGAAIVSSTTTSTLLGHGYYHDLTAAELEDSEVLYCYGVFDAAEDSAILLDIINKGIRSIPEEEVKPLRTKSLLNVQVTRTWRDVLYDGQVLIMLLLCMTIMLLLMLHAHRREKKQSGQVRRLMEYVGHFSETVMEVEPAAHRKTIFSVTGERLTASRSAYSHQETFQYAMHPDDYAQVKDALAEEALSQLSREGGERVIEARFRDMSGAYRWKILTLDGIKPDAAHKERFMLFLRDVNDLREKEETTNAALQDALTQAENASQAKGDFMSRMSHEIRTPLNAIIGYLDIARDEHADPEKVDHCIERSQVASKHLLSIINDVLDISSIESGRMKIAHDDFDLTQMVNSLTTIFYAQCRAKGVTFEVHLDDIQAERVCGDELRVRQILLNLLSNAVKFTPAGGRITLSLRQITGVGAHSERCRMEFRVKDSGIGMSKEYLTRMFRPFEQEDASTARNYGGTGLGLSICNNLVHMMGGQLQVESEQGLGTTFTVLLPFDPAKTQVSSTAAVGFESLRVLVVDDEEDACTYTQKVLSRIGVRSDTVTSGKKALRRVAARNDGGKPYDLCIIDWNMAEMNGVDTAREVRRLCGRDIPIIIATAYDYTQIEDEAKAAGVDRIISKPLFQSTLFNLLVDLYGAKAPAASAQQKPVADFTGTRLLLAEDNEMNLEIALDILHKAGLVVTPAANGQLALDAFTGSAPGTFDAILMDIQMPVMDGYTAARRIRESSHPQAKTIPIIAMTANAFTEDVTAALAAGMNDHVSKPISYDRLFGTLKRLLRTSEKDEGGQH